MDLTRRDLLRRTTIGAAAAGLLGAEPLLRLLRAEATDNGVYPRFVWEPVTSVSAPRADSLFPSLLPAGHLTPSTALDAWYLWFWTHNDQTKLYLYTAPSPEGPFTGPRTLLSGMPTPFTPGYDSNHFDSGDIVWDAVGQRYVSSPHSINQNADTSQLGEGVQDSFLIQSTDGVTWSWLDGDNSPRLICGPAGSPDEVHTGYGRLLRDLDGVLSKQGGKYQWIYRAQRHDKSPGSVAGKQIGSPTLYRPWLASSPSLSTYPWTKDATQTFYTLPQPDVALIGFGSFLVAVGQYWVEYGCANSVGIIPSNELLVGGAATPGDLGTAKQTPITLPPESPSGGADAAGKAGATIAPGGGYIIRDPASGRQYMTVCSFNPQELQSGSGATPRVTIYRSVVA